MFTILAEQAVAIIQIIGLAVVTPAAGTGIDIVMPRVQSMQSHTTSPRHQTANAQAVSLARPIAGRATIQAGPIVAERNQVQPTLVPAPMIDDHIAIIAFPNGSLVAQSAGWNVQPLPPLAAEYSYVVLNGEHLQLLSAESNEVATVPGGLPKLNYQCSDRMLQQPYSPVWNAEYQPPVYPRAAAVIHVPRGKTDACLADVNGDVRGRADTRIHLNNGGTVVIEAKKNNQTKTLAFDGNTLLMIANAPADWVHSNGSGSKLDVRHYEAYYSMLDAAAATNCMRQGPPALARCDVATAARPSATQAGPRTNWPSTPPELFMTYECSNSQYP